MIELFVSLLLGKSMEEVINSMPAPKWAGTGDGKKGKGKGYGKAKGKGKGLKK